MEEKEQNIDKREQRILKGVFGRIESIDITTAVLWIFGLTVIYLMRDVTSLGFTSFQNLCIVLFWVVMVFLMIIAMHQTMIYQKLIEIGGMRK